MSDVFHPLVYSMEKVGEISPYFMMPIRDSDQDNWVDAEDLLLGDGDRLKNLVQAYGHTYWGSTNPHVAASAFIIAYLTRLVWPVMGQYILWGRVPDVSLANLTFHWKDGRPDTAIDATAMQRPAFALLRQDEASGHADASPVVNSDQLYARLKQWLLEENLNPVIESLVLSTGASRQVSRNAVASACAQAFHRLYGVAEDTDALLEKASLLFNDSSSLIYGQLTMEEFQHQGRQGFFARRRGCCLAWRTELTNGYCSNCILVPKEEQDRLFCLIEDGGWRNVG